MRAAFALIALLPLSVSAEIFKCTDSAGRVAFLDRPCDASAGQAGQALEIKSPQYTSKPPERPTKEELDARWEEAKRFYYVELPAAERKAAALMASPDPKAQELGRELAWKVREGREAFIEMKKLYDE